MMPCKERPCQHQVHPPSSNRIDWPIRRSRPLVLVFKCVWFVYHHSRQYVKQPFFAKDSNDDDKHMCFHQCQWLESHGVEHDSLMIVQRLSYKVAWGGLVCVAASVWPSECFSKLPEKARAFSRPKVITPKLRVWGGTKAKPNEKVWSRMARSETQWLLMVFQYFISSLMISFIIKLEMESQHRS